MERIITEKSPEDIRQLLEHQMDKFRIGEVTREQVLLRINGEIEEMLDTIRPS